MEIAQILVLPVTETAAARLINNKFPVESNVMSNNIVRKVYDDTRGPSYIQLNRIMDVVSPLYSQDSKGILNPSYPSFTKRNI